MNSEKAIEVLENGAWWEYLDNLSCDAPVSKELHEALDVALEALRSNTQVLCRDCTHWQPVTIAEREKSSGGRATPIGTCIMLNGYFEETDYCCKARRRSQN